MVLAPQRRLHLRATRAVAWLIAVFALVTATCSELVCVIRQYDNYIWCIGPRLLTSGKDLAVGCNDPCTDELDSTGETAKTPYFATMLRRRMNGPSSVFAGAYFADVGPARKRSPQNYLHV